MAKPTLTELLAQRAELEKQIAEAQRHDRADAIAQVRTLMAQYGLTLADIGTKSSAPVRSVGNASVEFNPMPKDKTKDKAKVKVAAKYRDSASGQTWAGRGLQPNWLKVALASGRKLSDFAL